jgi:hypothetical protein
MPVVQMNIIIFLVIPTYLKILVVLTQTKKKKVKMALPGPTSIMIFLVIPTYLKILVVLTTKSNYFFKGFRLYLKLVRIIL